jgi:hypothetical protein
MTFMRATVALLVLLAGQVEAKEAAGKVRIVTAVEVNGVWENSEGNQEFKVLALGQQRLRVEFFGTWVGSSAGANIGEATGIARIEGATAVFKPKDTISCTFTLKFQDGLMKVSQEGDSAACGFGMNVSAEGIYRKTQAGKPKFAQE